MASEETETETEMDEEEADFSKISFFSRSGPSGWKGNGWYFQGSEEQIQGPYFDKERARLAYVNYYKAATL